MNSKPEEKVTFLFTTTSEPKKIPTFTAQVLDEARKEIKDAKTYRGHILSLCVDIEQTVTSTINQFFLKSKDPSANFLFKRYILFNKKMRFEEKLNILEEMIVKELIKGDKKLVEGLHNVRNERNLWAHGEFVFAEKDVNKDSTFDNFRLVIKNPSNNHMKDVNNFSKIIGSLRKTYQQIYALLISLVSKLFLESDGKTTPIKKEPFNQP